MNKKLKFELTQVDNGFILGIVNPEYRAGSGDASNNYYKHTFVSNQIDALPNLLLTHLVAERMGQ